MQDHQTENTGKALLEGSLRGLLSRNVGCRAALTFVLGTDRVVTKEGILTGVGTDYAVLYQPEKEQYITGDLYCLKFVELRDRQT